MDVVNRIREIVGGRIREGLSIAVEIWEVFITETIDDCGTLPISRSDTHVILSSTNLKIFK